MGLGLEQRKPQGRKWGEELTLGVFVALSRGICLEVYQRHGKPESVRLSSPRADAGFSLLVQFQCFGFQRTLCVPLRHRDTLLSDAMTALREVCGAVGRGFSFCGRHK